MSIPSNEDILALLAQLDDAIADALESEFLDFKPSLGPKEDLKVACEYAVCFANAAGGVVVFGVADKQRGRAQAIVGTHGHDVDVFKRGIYDGTRPGIEAEVLELSVPQGTGKLLIVRVPEGQQKSYGTAAGLFKQRVGKNGMPLDRVAFQRAHTGVARVRGLSFCAGAGVAAFQEMVLTRRFSHQECSAGEAVLHVALR